jgi:hypothetical protein
MVDAQMVASKREYTRAVEFDLPAFMMEE